MSKNENALITLEAMQQAAKAVAPTFGIMPDQCLALLLIAQAEGLHPMAALRIYHIIEGKPAMRADAMQAKFQERGGIVQWLETSEQKACARFSHPKFYPEPTEVSLTYKEMQERGITDTWDQQAQKWKPKKNWKCHAAAMLRARVISAGVRMVDPGTVVGLYTPEEIEDMDEKPAQDVHVHQTADAARHESIRSIAAEEPPKVEITAATSPEISPAPAPKADSGVHKTVTKPAGPTPQQQTITPPAGNKALPLLKKGEEATIDHLLASCRRLVEVVGPKGREQIIKRLGTLNEKHKCGIDPVKKVRATSLCPADQINEYYLDVEEEIRWHECQNQVEAGIAKKELQEAPL